MYKQTEDYYKTLMMGFGTGSIYDFGCYLVSLCNGINEFGHKYTPREFNQLLKDKNLFTGEYKNYINVDRLDDVLPEIFISFKKIEPWNDMGTLNWYLSRDYVVLAKVDAKGIGGSGTHFVIVTDTIDNDAIIFDPWTSEHQPVANRYNKYGNILGLRVFGVINNKSGGPMTLNDGNIEISKKKFEELVTKATTRDEYAKIFSSPAQAKQLIQDLRNDIKAKAETISNERARADDNRIDYKNLLALVAKSIGCNQEINEVTFRLKEIETTLTEAEDIKTNLATCQVEGGEKDEKIAQISALLKERVKLDSLQDLPKETLIELQAEIIREVLRRLKEYLNKRKGGEINVKKNSSIGSK